MGYIMNLRKYVGHDPLIMTSACVLILNNNGQLLLQKRRDNEYWGYPGGSLELGESFEEAAIREAFEETGLKLKELKFFSTASGKDMHYIYPNGDVVYIAESLFICNRWEGELIAQESEVMEQKFFDLDKLPVNISPINKTMIDKFKNSYVV